MIKSSQSLWGSRQVRFVFLNQVLTVALLGYWDGLEKTGKERQINCLLHRGVHGKGVSHYTDLTGPSSGTWHPRRLGSKSVIPQGATSALGSPGSCPQMQK